MKSFFLALQFLTRIPLDIFREKPDDRDFVNSLTYYPLVGFLIGAMLCVLNSILSVFVPELPALAAVFIFYLVITGCLHIDGFMDTVDGLYGGKDKESIMKIMDDSRIGAAGAAFAVALMIFKISALYGFIPKISSINAGLLMMTTLSRCGAVVVMAFSPYAKKEGAGRALCGRSSLEQLLIAGAFAFILAAIFGAKGILAFVAVCFASYFLSKYFHRKLGGLTGDTIGFSIEALEGLILFIMCLKIV